MRMINSKYGYVSSTEAKIFGDLDRWLKRKHKGKDNKCNSSRKKRRPPDVEDRRK